MMFTPDNIDNLKENEVFVFGSNWDWENLAREQGHLAWINDWLNIVKRYLKKMSSQD